MIDTNIKDKVILVAGATGGIGSEIVKKLDHSGATLILLGRSETLLKELNDTLTKPADYFVCDLSQTETIKDIFLFTKENDYKLDGMVHAVGQCKELPVKNVSIDDMKENMNLNYFSYVELCKHFSSKRYSNDGSSIVIFSSIAAAYCDKAMSQYAASKAAINAATKCFAKEFTKRKIRVNAISPGAVLCDMGQGTPDLVEGGYGQVLQERQPYGRVPLDEIANLTEFLLSDVSGHITGEIIPIIGGVY